MIEVKILDDGNTNLVTVDVAPVSKETFPVYEGSYTVIPDTSAVTLNTKDHVMANDVTVFKIPLWEVSNAVGTTLIIGGNYGN